MQLGVLMPRPVTPEPVLWAPGHRSGPTCWFFTGIYLTHLGPPPPPPPFGTMQRVLYQSYCVNVCHLCEVYNAQTDHIGGVHPACRWVSGWVVDQWRVVGVEAITGGLRGVLSSPLLLSYPPLSPPPPRCSSSVSVQSWDSWWKTTKAKLKGMRPDPLVPPLVDAL